MRHYFRVQPAGLCLDHRSETSSGEIADGLHVFLNASEAESLPDGIGYGDEVVVLQAPRHWPNGDVEGVCVDGAKASIIARVPHATFRAADWEDGFTPVVQGPPLAVSECTRTYPLDPLTAEDPCEDCGRDQRKHEIGEP